MNNWNKLLALLDLTLGFANRQSSNVKKVWQAFDNKTHEHVVWLEYRVRALNDQPSGKSNRELKRLQQVATDLMSARVPKQ